MDKPLIKIACSLHAESTRYSILFVVHSIQMQNGTYIAHIHRHRHTRARTHAYTRTRTHTHIFIYTRYTFTHNRTWMYTRSRAMMTRCPYRSVTWLPSYESVGVIKPNKKAAVPNKTCFIKKWTIRRIKWTTTGSQFDKKRSSPQALLVGESPRLKEYFVEFTKFITTTTDRFREGGVIFNTPCI